MISEGRPVRRLSRRARIAMLLFVVPALMYSAATRSDDDPSLDETATALPIDEVLLGRVSCDVRDGTLAELIGQIMSGVDPAYVVVDAQRLQADCKIAPDTKFTLEAEQIRRHVALSRALHPRGAGYFVKNGTIRITSQRGIENDLGACVLPPRIATPNPEFPRTYSVADLLQIDDGKADYGPLVKRIKQEAAPGTWGDPDRITPYPNNLSLVIMHNELGHEAVEMLLVELRQAARRDAK